MALGRVAILVVVLFGYKKLPDAARSLGRSLRIFKTEIKGMSEDDKARAEAAGRREGSRQPRALPAADVVKTPSAANDGPRPGPRPRRGPHRAAERR